MTKAKKNKNTAEEIGRDYDEKKAEALRSDLLSSAKASDSIREFKITPEEMISTLNFMKSRVADLTFEVAHSEAKYKKLALYCQALEEKLGITTEVELTDLVHPDA